MGIFAAIGCHIKSVANKVASGVKKAFGKAKEVTTNLWNKFSGKNTYEEAKRLYEKLSARYDRRKRQFDQDLERLTNLIESHIESINGSKAKIKRTLFPQMAEKMKRIKDIPVSDAFTVEEYEREILSFDSVRSKEQLFRIDFDKYKVKATVQALFTLGFYTRKRAKESLNAVREEKDKVVCEMEKMDAETEKLERIEEALGNVAHYFTSLIEMYENMLVRLDTSVNYLYVRCLSIAHKLIHKEMSIRHLPKMQQKEIEAIITASLILKKMVEMQINSVEDQETATAYDAGMKGQFDEIEKEYHAA